MAVFSGIAAAIATFSTWFAALSPLAQIGLRLLAGVAFNALSRALAGEPKKPRPPGITGQIQQGADLPRSFILGRYATAGSLVYHNTWGKSGRTPNAYYTRVTALSDLPITALEAVWIDGERMVLGTTPDPDGKGLPILKLTETRTVTRRTDGSYADEDIVATYGWVKLHDGTQTTADDFLVNTVSSDARPWSFEDVGYGVAYAVTTFKFNRKRFNRLPQVIFEVQGLQLEAPDGTDAGASTNPVVQIWHLLKGLSWGGERLYGPATPAYLDAAEWQAEADLCDQEVPGGTSMTASAREEAFGSTAIPARYRAALEVDVSRDVADVIEDVLAACNGRIAYTGAGYRVQVGDPQAAAATLTDADILSTARQSFAPFAALAETVNSVAATYPEPEEAWQQQEAPPLIVDAYEDEERGRRLPTSVDLPAVPYREQVQRLMAAALAEARRARRHTVTLPARYWTLLPGDFLDWTSTRNGYEGKRFRVDGVMDLPAGDVQVDLTEVDASDYAWSADADYTPVARGSVTAQPIGAATLGGFTLSPIAVPDETGADRRPAILLSWTDPDDEAVEAVLWQVRLPTGSAVTAGRTPDVALQSHAITEGILPATVYEVRARLDAPGLATPWTAWTSVTTLDVRLDGIDLEPTLKERIDTAYDRHDTALESATGTVGALRDSVDQDFAALRGGWTGDLDGFLADRAPTLTLADLTAVSDDIASTYATQATLTADYYTIAEADQAISAATSTLKSEIEDPAGSSLGATLEQDYYTIAGTDAAISAASTTLRSELGAGVFNLPTREVADAFKIPAETTCTEVADGLAIQELAGNPRSTTGDTSGVSFEIPADLALSYAGRRVRISLRVRADTATAFAVAYSTNQVGNSGLLSDTATAQARWFSFYYDVPSDSSSGTDYIGVFTDNAGGTIVLSHIRVEVAVAEGEIPEIAQISATLTNDHYTIAETDSAISAATTALKSEIEDPSGTSLGATLEQDYLTATETDSAISAATSTLKSEIEDPNGTSLGATVDDLAATRVTASGAVAAVESEISASYNGLTALASATAFAEATVQGIETGYVWSLGDLDVLSLVQVQDGQSAPVTTARIKSDYIRLDGETEVTGDFLVSADAIVSGTMSAARLRVDEMMTIEPQAGFRAGLKSSPGDDSDGVYFGAPTTNTASFAFALSRTPTSGVTERIEATDDVGLRITNAQFYRTLAVTPAVEAFLTSTTYTLPAGTAVLTLEMIAGGGGGAGANWGEGAGPGTDGGDTVVELRDGTTVVQSWTLAGGAGGNAAASSGTGEDGESSTWGTGGTGGERYYTYTYESCDYSDPKNPSCSTRTGTNHETPGGNASGHGAGGGGGGAKYGSGSAGGAAGAFLSKVIDVSGLSNPNVVMQIGGAGAGGSGASGGAGGGDGSPGRVTVLAETVAPRRADVVPLTPQATGSMQTHGPFPDLGAGLWVLHVEASQSNIGFGDIEINEAGQVYHPTYGSTATFVSSKTPVVLTTPHANRTVYYQFFKMGE